MSSKAVIVVILGMFVAISAVMIHLRPSEGDEGRQAAQKSIPRQGVAVGVSDQTKAEIQAIHTRRFNYRGTEIKPSADTDDELLRLQQQISSAFASLDPSPRDRTEAFSWCLAGPNVTLIGWYGLIKNSRRLNDGWQIEIQVSPRLAGAAATVFTPDYCVETWKYTDEGKLFYINCVHPEQTMRVLLGD